MQLAFRQARPDEALELSRLTLDGLRYWGHDTAFPELIEEFRQNELPTAEYIRTSPVYVLLDEGRLVGFYGLYLHEEDDFVDLRYMFLDTAYIGRGLGRKLWQEAVQTARSMEISTMRIVSDPMAVGFYAAMGAERGGEIAVRPGFVLTVFWFDLTKLT